MDEQTNKRMKTDHSDGVLSIDDGEEDDIAWLYLVLASVGIIHFDICNLSPSLTTTPTPTTLTTPPTTTTTTLPMTNPLSWSCLLMRSLMEKLKWAGAPATPISFSYEGGMTMNNIE